MNEKAEAEEYIRMIVTDARVMKCYHKLVDDGILPEKFELKHMKHVAQNLPKAVYEDCVKEELEILKKAGEFGTYRTKCVDRNRLQPLNFKGWGRFNLF